MWNSILIMPVSDFCSNENYVLKKTNEQTRSHQHQQQKQGGGKKFSLDMDTERQGKEGRN